MANENAPAKAPAAVCPFLNAVDLSEVRREFQSVTTAFTSLPHITCKKLETQQLFCTRLTTVTRPTYAAGEFWARRPFCQSRRLDMSRCYALGKDRCSTQCSLCYDENRTETLRRGLTCMPELCRHKYAWFKTQWRTSLKFSANVKPYLGKEKNVDTKPGLNQNKWWPNMHRLQINTNYTGMHFTRI